MKYTLTLGLTALFTCTAFAAFNAPLPEFKNEKELAQWRAENASKPCKSSATEEPAFFTGKPYLESSGSYAFKYRNYNPEIARWTSEDPSGFPDGANASMYAPNPATEVDPDGLARTVVLRENHKATITNYFSHDQMRISVGMDPTLVLNIRAAAFQEFQNNIAQAYSVGDPVIKGPTISVLTGLVEDNASLRMGYPKDEITSITYNDSSSFFDLGFTFNAVILSVKTYSYE